MWSRVDVKITRLPSGKKYEQASCPRSLMRHLVLPSSEKIQVSAPELRPGARTASGSCVCAMT